MIDWKDKRVQFAIGLAVLLIGLKWLITGTPFLVAEELRAPVEEGQTKSGVALTALMPVIVDMLIGAIIAIGAWVVNVFGMIASLINRHSTPVPAPTAAEGPVTISPQDQMRQNVIDLGRAAANNDRVKFEALRAQIRKPQAIAELTQALESGDTNKAAMLQAELADMMREKQNAG